jgi:ABC-2 type transport system permease protein
VIFVSGVFYDAAHAPGFIKGIAQALPLKHLIDGLSGAMVHQHSGLSANISALGVIAAWAVLGVALAVRGFSWEQRRS